MQEIAAIGALLMLPLAALAAETDPADVEGAVSAGPRPVVSEIVTANPAGERAFDGVVRGADVVTLAFQTSGRVARLEVEVGDLVEQGDVLAELDGVTLEEDLAAARASLQAAEAEARLAQQQYDRTETLVDRNVASEATLERVRANRDATAAQLESARAQLAQAEDAAAYGTLTAPRAAIVLSTEVEPGTLVSPGTGVVEIAGRSGREAVIDVPADFVELLSPGAVFEVRHHSDDVPPLRATLRLVEPVADSGLDTRRLRLTLHEPTPDYRIGSLVNAVFDTGDNAPLLTVPRAALAGTTEAPVVWRVDGDRRVHSVRVTLGRSVGDRVVVTEGLAAGDEVVVRGVGNLEDGQQVGERWK